MKKILLISITVVIVITTILAGTIWFLARKTSADNETLLQIGPVFDYFDRFVVDLADETSRRYLRFGITLEVENEAVLEELVLRQSQLRDVVIAISRDKTSTQLRGEKGQNLLRDEVLKELNAIVVRGTIVRLDFTEFFIQ